MSDDKQGNKNDSDPLLYCSFCGKSQHEVKKLIAGPTVFICDECVELCMDIIKEESKSHVLTRNSGVPSPSDIEKTLNDYVIGHSVVKLDNKLLNLFQSIDFFLLLVAARGAANLMHPWACTSQNQAYRKSLYQKVGGFSRIKNQIEGDDSLFLNVCRKRGKAVVVFADALQSHVTARQEKTWMHKIAKSGPDRTAQVALKWITR